MFVLQRYSINNQKWKTLGQFCESLYIGGRFTVYVFSLITFNYYSGLSFSWVIPLIIQTSSLLPINKKRNINTEHPFPHILCQKPWKSQPYPPFWAEIHCVLKNHVCGVSFKCSPECSPEVFLFPTRIMIQCIKFRISPWTCYSPLLHKKFTHISVLSLLPYCSINLSISLSLGIILHSLCSTSWSSIRVPDTILSSWRLQRSRLHAGHLCTVNHHDSGGKPVDRQDNMTVEDSPISFSPSCSPDNFVANACPDIAMDLDSFA